MRILNAFSLIHLAFALSACVVVPVVDNNETASSSCKTYTRSMSLKAVDLQPNGCNTEECLATVLVIAAGSALVSGSIVLAGNTVHWLEYQGTCGDGYLHATRRLFLESLGKPKPAPAS